MSQKNEGIQSASVDNYDQIDLANRVRNIANAMDKQDRIPRIILKGKLAINKLLAEKLFIKMRNLELERAPNVRVWQFRKAAWAIDELD